MTQPISFEALEAMDRDALTQQWVKAFDTQVPKKMSVAYLRRFLAFDLQARRLGGLAPSLKAKIKAFEGALQQRPRAARLQPGARLLRDWNGTTHVVDVTPNGFEWRGQTYRSLSVVARTITGAHWSGPRFFGLNGNSTS
ncbi:MAG: DUF2924 domain-containing protein [Paracoccaceae bacterium]